MRALVAAELLDLWEAGTAQPAWEWTQALIRRCFPECAADALDRMTIGERDARLIEIREALFGRSLSGCSVCPACGARVEMDLQTSDLRLPSGALAKEADFSSAEGRVHFRVPTVGDLEAVAPARDVAGMRRALLQRCVLAVEQRGTSVDVSELSAETLNAVMGRMAECDPQADVRFQLRCPDCAQSWSEAFDIASYLWTELDTWAQRTLQDVHRLASAYGWREADALAISPQRRSRYLEMINA